jgi:predicted nucleotidyltransferase component of viral defense system
MINSESIESNWIAAISKEKRADPILVEKVIRALWLLEGLIESGVPFILKGGTALMLKLGSQRRLSIDIDIIIETKDENLPAILSLVAEQKGFIKAEEQKRNAKSAIEKEHYKFYYKPVTQNAEEAHILLDILFGSPGYHKIETIGIESSFLKIVDKLAIVTVPSFEDLTGDKLTAFAPETTGIPYFKNDQSASMEIIKQLYDLGYLFDHIGDLDVIRKTFARIAQTELKYRNLDKSPRDVLEDTYQVSLCLASRGQLGNGNFEELFSGVKRIQPYIFSERYHIDKAIANASRIAHLTRLLLGDEKIISRYGDVAQVKDWSIEDQSMNKLNKLKKINPEAYYYWYTIITMQSKAKQTQTNTLRQ